MMHVMTGLNSKSELETLSKLAATEMRIYKIYADLSHNELRKEKLGALNSIKRAQDETEECNREIQDLEVENAALRAIANRYRRMVTNFEVEYASVKRHLAEKEFGVAGSSPRGNFYASTKLRIVSSPEATAMSDRASAPAGTADDTASALAKEF